MRKSAARLTWGQWGLVFLLLLLFFAQAARGGSDLSLTYDEPIYIGIGYADLVTRDMAWHGHIGHPPLVNLLTAWPLLLSSTRPDPRDLPQWGSNDVLGFCRQMLAQLGSLDQVAFVTRMPVTWIALFLGALVFRWTAELWGRKAGLLALAFFVFDPTVVAHARLNTTDMGIAAFGFLACYATSCFFRQPSARRLTLAGLALGLPLASKASGPFYLGIAQLLLAAFAVIAWRRRHGGKWLWSWLACGTAWVVLALAVLWAAYFFEVRSLEPGGIPLPAASHWFGLPYINSYMQTGQVTFLWGKLYMNDQPWGYFPLAFLVKTPLPTLILLALAAGDALRRRARRCPDAHLWSKIVLVVVPAAYFLMAMGMALQIGQRHLLPIYPFLFVLVGRLVRPAWERRWATWPPFCKIASAISGLLLLAWLTFSSLLVQPFQLSYFSELAGGPDRGYRYFADSSVDWGQNLKVLRQYLETNDLVNPRLAAFSSLDPALYGLHFEPLPPTEGAPVIMPSRFNPASGIYVISTVPLQGIWVLDPDTYDWFRRHDPMTSVGHSFLVYRVDPPTVSPRWVAQCATPLPPLGADQIEEGFGVSHLRLISFDCQQSWIYPADGAGWYVLPADLAEPGWSQEALAGIEPSYVQREHWSHPAVSIYAWEERGIESISWQTLVYLPEGQAMEAPVTTSGPLDFLGYQVVESSIRTGEPAELRTFWRVNQVPDRLLSLMVHLVGPDGTTVAVGDGLGVTAEQWQPGDIISQRHLFSIPVDSPAGEYWLRMGAYWLDTLERWQIGGVQGADAVFAPLENAMRSRE